MAVFNQFCGLLLGIHLLAFVQCQRDSCTLQEFRQSDMFDEHFDLSNLPASFTLGKAVRVPCQVGYRGFFRLVCSDRGWMKYGAICKKILCGHPGDVQFADFQLVKGTNYDFGSQVQYTCHKGYQMTSYTSTRNCLERGWDGHLPECEPISCPKPPLENFVVEGVKQEYKKNEFLTYNCISGYKKMDGRPSQCKRVGLSFQWVPMPRCEPITCKLSFIPPEETTYNPQNQIIFRIGETVMVSCGEKHWVKSIELQAAELTCQEDTGDWDFEPLCRPVTCSKYDQRIKHVDRWQWTSFNTVRMNETLTYQCHPNYVETSPRATCTRRGWEPNPLCEEILCPKPPEKNFTVQGEKTVYRNNEVLTYSCNPGYRKVHNQQIKCQKKENSSQWIPEPQCEAVADCGPLPEVPNMNTTSNILKFSDGHTFPIQCDTGYQNLHTGLSELICTNGTWTANDVSLEDICTLKFRKQVDFW